MRIVADTHAHLYDAYDLAAALRALSENLGRLDAGAMRFGFLTERGECDFFRRLADDGARVLKGAFTTRLLPGDGVLELSGNGPPLYLVAGRQIATVERLEVLALAMTARFPDGRTVIETMRGVLDAGGVPVLAWAFGKWLGARRRIVSAAIDAFRPGELLLGDSSLRPIGWPEPRAIRRGLARGFGVVAGSDALPVAGEERRLGNYGSVLDADMDLARPLASLCRALRAVPFPARRVGRRCGPLEVLARLRHCSRAAAP